MRRRDLLTALGAVSLVPLSWETWRRGRVAWSLTRPPEIVVSPDESRSLDLERSLLTLLSDLRALPAGAVDPGLLAAVVAAHHAQLTALTDARGAGPDIVPRSGAPSTLTGARSGQRALAEQAHAAALQAEDAGFATLFAAVEAGTRQQMGVLA